VSSVAFGVQARDWAENLKRKINDSVQEATIDTLSTVIDLTPVHRDGTFFPVDDYQTKESWRTTVGSPSDAPGELSEHWEHNSGAVGRARGESKKDLVFWARYEWKPTEGRPLFFTNPDEYSVDLEYGLYNFRNPVNTDDEGFSTQAPEGMVRVNLPRFNKYLRRRWHGGP
jgi:hypothetical protein